MTKYDETLEAALENALTGQEVRWPQPYPKCLRLALAAWHRNEALASTLKAERQQSEVQAKRLGEKSLQLHEERTRTATDRDDLLMELRETKATVYRLERELERVQGIMMMRGE